jgi:hypothetical protein
MCQAKATLAASSDYPNDAGHGETEKFRTALPISDALMDDDDAMAFPRQDAIARWPEMVAERGYTPAGEPTVSLDVLISYGWPLFDGDEPMLGDDGEQLIDHTKAVLSVTGPVVRA